MIPKQVEEILNKHNLQAIVFEPGSTPTVAKAAEKLGVTNGQIAKSLMFKGKDNYYVMVICAGDRKVASGKLKKITGQKMSMASAEEINQKTGFLPGGVCPFGVTNMPIILDHSLNDYELVYPAAGTDASGIPITPAQLFEITAGTYHEVTNSI